MRLINEAAAKRAAEEAAKETREAVLRGDGSALTTALEWAETSHPNHRRWGVQGLLKQPRFPLATEILAAALLDQGLDHDLRCRVADGLVDQAGDEFVRERLVLAVKDQGSPLVAWKAAAALAGADTGVLEQALAPYDATSVMTPWPAFALWASAPIADPAVRRELVRWLGGAVVRGGRHDAPFPSAMLAACLPALRRLASFTRRLSDNGCMDGLIAGILEVAGSGVSTEVLVGLTSLRFTRTEHFDVNEDTGHYSTREVEVPGGKAPHLAQVLRDARRVVDEPPDLVPPDDIMLPTHVPLECPCGHRGRAKAEYAGQTVQCPMCKRLLTAPALNG